MMDVLDGLAATLGVQASVLAVLLGVTGVLVGGSMTRLLSLSRATSEVRQSRLASLRTWWELWIVVAIATLAGRSGIFVLLAIFSGWGLHEYLSLAFSQPEQRRQANWLLAAIPAHYGVMFYSGTWSDSLVVPLLVPLVIGAALAAGGTTSGFLRVASALSWGTTILVLFLSHAGFFYFLPEAQNRVGGGAGWFLFLIVLTECNDIAQALWGRRFGRHPITPRVSPHKTWEGFLLGTATTTILALVLAPWLTTLSQLGVASMEPTDGWFAAHLPAAFAGMLIGVGGFFGDIVMSALKRDAGVKDSSQVLPGQGGILDRIDSLTFTAPLFFYYAVYLNRE